jgi:hypothetical protein
MSVFTSLVVLAFVVSIGLFILGAGLANAAAKKRPRPPMNAVPASHPQTPARATNPCAARGHVIPGWAHTRDVWFCVREGCTYTAAYCRDEDLPYDQEAVAVFDAARQITREAAGGAA